MPCGVCRPVSTSMPACDRAGPASRAVGCLRNAAATAQWIASHLRCGRTVAVIAAGERWAGDDSLRPALEDQLGAGAIVSALAAQGFGGCLSPEADAARSSFEDAQHVLGERLRECVGGRELIARGFQADVAVAAQLDAGTAVPVLHSGRFQAGP